MKLFAREDEEDHDERKGRLKTDSGYSALIAMYPVLTPNQWKWSMGKLVVSFFTLIGMLLHLGSVKYALQTGTIDVSIENISFAMMLASHFYIFISVVVNRETVRGMFKKVGSGFYKYEEPVNDDLPTFFNSRRVEFLFRANRDITLSACVFYFVSVPTMKVYFSGSWSTETDKEGEYPFNKNLPARIPVPTRTDSAATFIPTSICIILLCVYGSLMMTCTANMFLGLTVQIWNEMRLLISSLRDLNVRAIYLYKKRYHTTAVPFGSTEFRDCLVYCLKENINHHNEIIKFFKGFKLLFANWSFYQLLTSGIIISLDLYGVLKIDASQTIIRTVAESLGKAMLVSLNVFHASVYCLAGQRISNLSEDVYEAFYFTDWFVGHTKEMKSLLLITLACSKEPWVLKGYGIIPAKAETLVDILKTAFSLLSFVKFLIG